jgi:hypothetical protein
LGRSLPPGFAIFYLVPPTSKGIAQMSSRPPEKLRKRYRNSDYPLVMLKFEDGHEIKI